MSLHRSSFRMILHIHQCRILYHYNQAYKHKVHWCKFLQHHKIRKFHHSRLNRIQRQLDNLVHIGIGHRNHKIRCRHKYHMILHIHHRHIACHYSLECIRKYQNRHRVDQKDKNHKNRRIRQIHILFLNSLVDIDNYWKCRNLQIHMNHRNLHNHHLRILYLRNLERIHIHCLHKLYHLDMFHRFHHNHLSHSSYSNSQEHIHILR
mmetsp:Transcript_6431/g.7918  ORF Transcript_6431/g.7918 Transcript_6431/m.7918 type:complete len:206 (-) Transcript_6431:401-1018(-)